MHICEKDLGMIIFFGLGILSPKEALMIEGL